jgi:hypothetical protein
MPYLNILINNYGLATQYFANRDQLRLERLPGYAPGRDGLRETLRVAGEQFLSSEWNCRIDHQTRRDFISRIFKMYAKDFAGARGSAQSRVR